MSAPEAAFVRAITAAGSDPTPPLVFADWLDEHNQLERAQFIRDQVLVATPSDTPERRLAAKRAFDLKRRFGKRWARLLARHAHDCQFRLGFPDLVGLTAAKLRRNAPALFAHSPIRSLLVTGLGGDLSALARVPPENGVERLSLWGARLAGHHLGALASLPNWPRLTTLSLLFNSITDADIPTLAGHPFFRNLARLELGANPFTEAGRDELRAAFGERVSFDCEREDDCLYNIESDYCFTNGFGPGETQYVILRGDQGFAVARFDLAGKLLESKVLPPRPEPLSDPDAERSAMAEELGVRQGTVRVKRFRHAEGCGIEAFARHWQAAASDHADDDHDDALDWVEHWLADGKFAWRFPDDDIWLDRSGGVTDT